jgi:hypothetical protein
MTIGGANIRHGEGIWEKSGKEVKERKKQRRGRTKAEGRMKLFSLRD